MIPMPEGRWQEVVDRDEFCRVPVGWSERQCAGRLVVHHRLLRSQGGTHDLDNLILLCTTHHLEVHDQPAASYEAGLLLRTSV